MKIYRSIDDISDSIKPVATIGTFDGVHLGHRKVIEHLNLIAKERHTESLIITFEPHPRIVLNKEVNKLRFINNPSEKAKLLDRAGVKHLLVLPFTYDFSKITARDFIKNYLINKLHIQAMTVGYDHHFGRMDGEKVEDVTILLREYGIAVERIPEQDIENVSVSSTKIRKAIMEGNIPLANRFLTYRYGLCGTVVHGNKIGRTIGFPTANLMLSYKLKLIPQDGVYAAFAIFKGKSYKAMLNIGLKPTVLGSERSIEVHMFDFDREIYGEYLEIELVEKIRDEQTFPNLERLKYQLEQDRDSVLKILSD